MPLSSLLRPGRLLAAGLVLLTSGCALPKSGWRLGPLSRHGTAAPAAVKEKRQADGTVVRRALLENKTEDAFVSDQPADDVARYLAGLPGGSGAPLQAARREEQWALHTNNLNELWRRFDTLRRAPINSFASRELGHLRSPGTLFYPFSGPDYLFADAFFPGARNYVLCGLESCELMPDLARLSEGERREALNGLYTSLTSALNFSFFITKDMRVDLQRTEIKGTLPILLVFLARSGHHIDEITPVSLDANGAVTPRGSGPAGLRIVFRDNGLGAFTGSKTLYYFTTDLSNETFSSTSRFAKFVRALGPCVSFTKSASYLMHEESFSHIRQFVLDQSFAVLQDDSGIPYGKFDRAQWDVETFGRYSGVLDIFKSYYQTDLAKAAEASAGPLGFGIGYKYTEGQSAMILARKR